MPTRSVMSKDPQTHQVRPTLPALTRPVNWAVAPNANENRRSALSPAADRNEEPPMTANPDKPPISLDRPELMTFTPERPGKQARSIDFGSEKFRDRNQSVRLLDPLRQSAA